MSGTFSALLSKAKIVFTLSIQRLFDLASLLSIGSTLIRAIEKKLNAVSIPHLTIHDGEQHLSLIDLVWVYLEQVLIQHDKIRQLSGLQ